MCGHGRAPRRRRATLSRLEATPEPEVRQTSRPTSSSLSIQTGDATDSGYSATLVAGGRVLLAGGYALLSSGGLSPTGEVLGFVHLYRP